MCVLAVAFMCTLFLLQLVTLLPYSAFFDDSAFFEDSAFFDAVSPLPG